MVTISINDARPGKRLEIDDVVYQVVDRQHVKPGKGPAFVRTKLRNIRQGTVVDRTFRAGEKVELADVSGKELQYLYRDGDEFHFMDLETYEQMAIPETSLGDTPKYLKESDTIQVLFYKGEAIDVEMPSAVDLKVTETQPGMRGDTVSGAGKPATLETGYVVTVPLFINEGDILRVDTRSGAYIERAK